VTHDLPLSRVPEEAAMHRAIHRPEDTLSELQRNTETVVSVGVDQASEL